MNYLKDYQEKGWNITCEFMKSLCLFFNESLVSQGIGQFLSTKITLSSGLGWGHGPHRVGRRDNREQAKRFIMECISSSSSKYFGMEHSAMKASTKRDSIQTDWPIWSSIRKSKWKKAAAKMLLDVENVRHHWWRNKIILLFTAF